MIDYKKLLDKPMQAVNTAIDLAERTHQALAVVLADCLPALIEIRQNEAEFASFAAQEYGAKVTGNSVDATCLRLIKVVFQGVSAKYDFRRQFNHLTVALLHLEQQQVPVEHAAQYIRDVGGIAACVTAYRKANQRENHERKVAELRRTETYVASLPKIGVTTALGDGKVTTINTAQDQQTLAALAPKPGRVLILGYIDENFDLRLEGIVERDADEIGRFLARKARVAPLTDDHTVPVSCALSAINDNTKSADDTPNTEEAA